MDWLLLLLLFLGLPAALGLAIGHLRKVRPRRALLSLPAAAIVLFLPPTLWAIGYGWRPYPAGAQLMLVPALAGLFAVAAFTAPPLLAPLPLLAMLLVGVALAVPVTWPVMVGDQGWGFAWFAIGLAIPALGCLVLRRLRLASAARRPVAEPALRPSGPDDRAA